MARLQLLGAALLFSTGGFAIKSCDLSGWQVACFRCGVAALALWLLLPAARCRWRWRDVLVGCAYAATLVCYALSTKLTTAANAIFLQSTAPLYIMILAPLVLAERIRRSELGLGVAMAVGLVLVLSGQDVSSASAPDPASGNVFGALAGVCWALTVIGLRGLSDDAGATRARDAQGRGAQGRGATVALVAGNVIGFVACLPMALGETLWSPGHPTAPVDATDWAWIVYLGVVQIGLAYLLLTSGLRSLPAFEASLLLLAEPVFNPLWTWLLHGEIPSRLALVGGACILGATAAKTFFDVRRQRRIVRIR